MFLFKNDEMYYKVYVTKEKHEFIECQNKYEQAHH